MLNSNVINLSIHQYPVTNRLALRSGLLAFNGDDYRLVDDYTRLLGFDSKFQRAKVLVNFHLTSMTLLLLDALLALGAQVYFTSMNPLVVHDVSMGEYDALTPLQNSGIPHAIGDASLASWHSLSWDVMIDSGGCLYQLVASGQLRSPSKGIIDFAKTPYPEVIALPVIDVDGADITARATEEAGKSFIRALAHVWVQEKIVESNSKQKRSLFARMAFRDVFKKRFVIVGLGRLGRHVARALLQAGLLPHNLVMVDKHRGMLQQARQLFPLSDSVLLYQGDNPVEILEERLNGAFCVIACTGTTHAMASWPESLFDNVNYLCNMGADHEWHPSMPASRFLGGVTHPLNFILATPISPAMFSLMTYTLLRSSEYALDRRMPLPAGVLPLPPLLEKQIAHSWLTHRSQYALSYRADYLAGIDQAVEDLMATLSQSSDFKLNRQKLLEEFGCC